MNTSLFQKRRIAKPWRFRNRSPDDVTIVGCVLTAIELNDQLCLAAGEIREERFDGELPDEFVIAEPTVAEA